MPPNKHIDYSNQRQSNRERRPVRNNPTREQMAALARRQAQYAANVQDLENTDDLEEDPRYYETHMPTSARRYQQQPNSLTRQGSVKVVEHYHQQPLRAHRQQLPPRQRDVYTDEIETTLPKSDHHKHSIHPLLYLGVGMIAMLALVVLVFSTKTWVQNTQNDWIYGNPRMFQTDAVVGHNDSPANPTHFLAVNLYRHILIIEIPGQDTSKMKVYNITTLFGDGENLTPVTLSFQDVTGDGKLDMLIHINNSVVAYINDNGGFRPARPGEVKGLLS